MKKQSFSPKLSSYDNPKTKEQRMKNTTYGKIPTEWEISLLKDACIKKCGVQTGPFGSQLHQKDYKQVGTPIITVEHLGENRIIHENLPLVSDEDLDRLNRYTLKEGDIVFSRVGSVDRRAFVKKDEEGWLFSGRCLRVRPDPKKVDPSYLSWFFGHPKFKEYIRRIAVGATMPSLNTNLLESVEIILPSLNEQKKIASILDSLNEKIELNRQMNSTLEQIAQALFKRWFIDFEFPDENGNPYRSSGGRMVDSELGEIPEGWGVKPIGELADFVRGFSYKGSEKFTEPPGKVFITLNNVYEGGGFKPEYAWIQSERLKERHLVREGDLIIPNTEQTKDGRLLGFPAIVYFPHDYRDETGVFSHHITKVTPFDDRYKNYLHFHLYFTQVETSSYHTGSVIWGLDVNSFKKNKSTVEPTYNTIEQFNKIMDQLFQKIIQNQKENKMLSQTRDSLLPKLMSGKIKIPIDEDSL